MSLYRLQLWASAVTVYHRVKTTDANGRTVTNWTRQMVTDAFYGHRKQQVLRGEVLTDEDKTICRIPADAGLTALERGDVLCKGTITTAIAQNSSPEQALSGVEHFTADIVSDNRAMKNTPHWFAEG